MNARRLKTILKGLEKQKAAPAQTECTVPDGAFKSAGEEQAVLPLPTTEVGLTLQVLFGEWTPRHEQIYGSWANDSTGWSHED